jgi:hypothetical protein
MARRVSRHPGHPDRTDDTAGLSTGPRDELLRLDGVAVPLEVSFSALQWAVESLFSKDRSAGEGRAGLIVAGQLIIEGDAPPGPADAPNEQATRAPSGKYAAIVPTVLSEAKTVRRSILGLANFEALVDHTQKVIIPRVLEGYKTATGKTLERPGPKTVRSWLIRAGLDKGNSGNS